MAVLLGLSSTLLVGCHSSSPEHLARCVPTTSAVRPWHVADGSMVGARWVELSAFSGMSGTGGDVVVIDRNGVTEAEGLRAGRFRGVLAPGVATMLAACINAPAYAAVTSHYSAYGRSHGKYCTVADAADITIATRGEAGPKRVTANALDLVVGAYGSESQLTCDMGYPAALRSLASGLYSLRAQLEAHGTRVA
jgi:hypothetical protein